MKFQITTKTIGISALIVIVIILAVCPWLTKEEAIAHVSNNRNYIEQHKDLAWGEYPVTTYRIPFGFLITTIEGVWIAPFWSGIKVETYPEELVHADANKKDRDLLLSLVEQKITARNGIKPDAVQIDQINDPKDAIHGSWWAKDQWEWFGWKDEKQTWYVLISFDGWDCDEVKTIPEKHKKFFETNQYYSTLQKENCYKHNKTTMNNDPNTTMLSLADAFEKKDTKAIEQLINDGYDGFRFSENWTDQAWQDYAEAFKNAKEVSAPSDREKIYQITIDGKPKDVKLTLSDKQIWLLEYRSFIVTPHFN